MLRNTIVFLRAFSGRNGHELGSHIIPEASRLFFGLGSRGRVWCAHAVRLLSASLRVQMFQCVQTKDYNKKAYKQLLTGSLRVQTYQCVCILKIIKVYKLHPA
jgi:hypothetical protein